MKYNKDLGIGLRISKLIDHSGEKVSNLALDLDISPSQLRRLLRDECSSKRSML